MEGYFIKRGCCGRIFGHKRTCKHYQDPIYTEQPRGIKEKLTPEEQAVFDAWTIEGKAPNFHHQWQARLQKEWPVLARAILRIVEKGTEGK